MSDRYRKASFTFYILYKFDICKSLTRVCTNRLYPRYARNYKGYHY